MAPSKTICSTAHHLLTPVTCNTKNHPLSTSFPLYPNLIQLEAFQGAPQPPQFANNYH